MQQPNTLARIFSSRSSCCICQGLCPLFPPLYKGLTLILTSSTKTWMVVHLHIRLWWESSAAGKMKACAGSCSHNFKLAYHVPSMVMKVERRGEKGFLFPALHMWKKYAPFQGFFQSSNSPFIWINNTRNKLVQSVKSLLRATEHPEKCMASAAVMVICIQQVQGRHPNAYEILAIQKKVSFSLFFNST